MNFKLTLTFFSIFFVPILVFSQTSVVLNWKNLNYDNFEVASFDSAIYLTEYSGLPSFQKMIKLTDNYYYEIEVYDTYFTDVNESEKNKLKYIELSEKIIYSSDVKLSSKTPFQRIVVFPYINKSGKYKKLTKFKYRYTVKKSLSLHRKYSQQINSVLKDGNWYKISVDEDGVYSLSYSDLQSLGVNVTNLDVNSIRLYGNSGGMLPRLNSEFRYDDIQENAIQIVDENNNGIFENGDLLLFYGKSVSEWSPNYNVLGKYNHSNHLYDDFNYYFINIDNSSSPKRIEPYSETLNGSEKIFFNNFNELQFHEKELTNFIQSGQEWYGEEFDADLTQSFSFNFPNITENSDVFVKSEVAARASTSPNFSYSNNGTQFMSVSLGTVSYGYIDDYATVATVEGQTSSNIDNFIIDVTFNRNSASHKGWLNSIEVCASRKLKFDGGQMNFRKFHSGGNTQLCGLIKNATLNDFVWNVTDVVNVKKHELKSIDNENLGFIYDHFSGNSDSKFVIFDGTEYKTPNLLGLIPNQNLHGETDFEMLIVSHPSFISAAQNLKDFHYNNSGSKCKIVTPEEIFNEFSSGKQDVSSIRDYCRYLYNLPNSTFKYLLIVGDASYDFKDRIQNNTNYVITYQSENSYSPLNTFSTDDYFGYLDDDEGLFQGDLLDIGIGRLPAKSLQEANIMIDKIINYHDKSNRGSWRNMICFIADDGDESDGNIHMSQADALCNIIDENYNNYNFDKLYLDIYNQESTPVGPRSEDCKNAINRRIDKGTLLINYTGHGGEKGLTKERIIDVDQILDWDNYNTLPLFVTATCEFGRLDNPQLTSGGEHIILNPNGGGVALLTTTRYVYSHLNYNLNTNFINSLFEKIDGRNPTLGDMFLKTKVLSGTSINSNKFTLLGDPMMSLAIPEYGVRTTMFPDTVSALGKFTFTGEVINEDSTKVNNFNGEIEILVFDKEIIAQTQGQQSSSPMDYKKQTNLIYKGTSSVVDGVFTFSFIVPQDIDYNFDFGRISYYAFDEFSNADASGWNESFVVGGISSDEIFDDIGPSIELYMNDKQFVSGGITNSTPTFLAFIEDSSGINTIGNSIGHDITITIDGDYSKKIILNDYYQAEKDSYQKGKVEYSLNNLSPGSHTIEFKVWDVFNNSSQSSIDFFVSETEDFIIDHLLNYPNPFTTNTSFYFEHNRPDQRLEVQIQIFTVSGKLVKTINSLQLNTGFRVGPINWNGKDDFQENIGRGTYIYKLKVKDESGEFVEKLEKLVILK